MRVALVYPPSADPTAPYLSVPTLTAWLRQHGVDVLPVDANLEAWEHVLRPAHLASLRDQLERRLARLDDRSALTHGEQLAYLSLWRARGDAEHVPGAIEDAIATLRDPERFFDREQYARAVATVDAAQRVVSAAHAPLSVDFTAYRTPFSLLSAEEIAADAQPSRDPFHDYFVELAERLRRADAKLIGISVAFPAQIQPAYSLAYVLRQHYPDAHVTVGGPALTQMLLRLSGERLERAIGPFSSAVVYEGELALLEMTRAIERGEDPAAKGRLIRGSMIEDLSILPVPDFSDFPLDRYLAPEPILPYDPTRGCYWGVCTFCHYGLAEVGTARYRERPPDTVLDHLEHLSRAHGARIFYFSQDVFSPKIALRIARGITARGLSIRWGTDMRPERSLTKEKCEELAKGGALNTALGVESASPRVLSLVDKGIPVESVRAAIENLSSAGVAVEAMCFSEFPTESFREAMDTVRFIESLDEQLAIFILGRFDLTHGSLVAQKPGEFGIRDVWHVEGDELGTGLFFAEKHTAKSDAELEELEAAVDRLSGQWQLRRYPWAGAVSTAHTMLHYERFGPGVFRTEHAPAIPEAPARSARARFDLDRCLEAEAREGEIWATLVQERRAVGRALYRELASAIPPLAPSPRRVRYAAFAEPVAVGRAIRKRTRVSGRRPSTAANATRSSPS